MRTSDAEFAAAYARLEEKSEATAVFARAFPGGANIVTPSIEDRGKVADGVYYEIGVGRSFSNKAQAGITVIHVFENSKKPVKDRQRSVLLTADTYPSVLEAAKQYVAKLKAELA